MIAGVCGKGWGVTLGRRLKVKCSVMLPAVAGGFPRNVEVHDGRRDVKECTNEV